MKDIRFGKIVAMEILLAFFIGSLPLIMAYRSDPNLQIVARLSQLNPGDPVIMYAMYLLAVHIVIWVINVLWLKPNDAVKNFLFNTHKFTHELGFAIQSIYRAIVGAIPTAIIMMIFKIGYSDATKAVLISILLTIGSLFMSVALTVLKEISKPK